MRACRVMWWVSITRCLLKIRNVWGVIYSPYGHIEKPNKPVPVRPSVLFWVNQGASCRGGKKKPALWRANEGSGGLVGVGCTDYRGLLHAVKNTGQFASEYLAILRNVRLDLAVLVARRPADSIDDALELLKL